MPTQTGLTETGDALIGPIPAPDLHVMTFNVRRPVGRLPGRSPDMWETRKPALSALLASELPAILGTQEVVPGQSRAIRAALGRTYRTVGHGRGADGRGEGCPIYYDSARLVLTEWSQIALSDRPDEPGSATWGNRVPRIVVSATFRDRIGSARFRVINTHFDHISRRSRVRSAALVRSAVANGGLPAIVTGDLNTGEGSEPVDELFADGTLVDAWTTAAERLTPEWGTFPNYREPRTERKRIDWIVTTPTIEVERIGMNDRRPDGVWPSDHLPVQAVVRIHAAGDRTP
ncbi:endonuclease/exonuclease/phosphatase family metal-dependent hydrolase [Labedella gwakjiensis]|uniref:Endonuclease/exonuclease/phosphatase family metal-dependent hydrolase n=2 Tax=Labedella gwakjiensis TaxID=390269 RepID=A0A2P8GWN5_9MICO|nr:endonuclease/exonuclease/phosphatase family protein [Labedella gwakjiensis]PSL38379.1 endonuclease/exonuclease/phosphatase family metal-dependent hydrolase [Labedella gwakjiensis]